MKNEWCTDNLDPDDGNIIDNWRPGAFRKSRSGVVEKDIVARSDG